MKNSKSGTAIFFRSILVFFGLLLTFFFATPKVKADCQVDPRGHFFSDANLTNQIASILVNTNSSNSSIDNTNPSEIFIAYQVCSGTTDADISALQIIDTSLSNGNYSTDIFNRIFSVPYLPVKKLLQSQFYFTL